MLARGAAFGGCWWPLGLQRVAGSAARVSRGKGAGDEARQTNRVATRDGLGARRARAPPGRRASHLKLVDWARAEARARGTRAVQSLRSSGAVAPRSARSRWDRAAPRPRPCRNRRAVRAAAGGCAPWPASSGVAGRVKMAKDIGRRWVCVCVCVCVCVFLLKWCKEGWAQDAPAAVKEMKRPEGFQRPSKACPCRRRPVSSCEPTPAHMHP